MESMASLAVPAFGYGIRYEHGLFRQVIADGWQREWPEDWLSFGNPWEFERPDVVYPVHFGGTIEPWIEADGTIRSVWRPAETVRAIAFDTPVVGWRGRHVNTLRHAPALVGPGRRSPAAGDLQRGRLPRRDGRSGPRRGDLSRSLSKRRHACG